MPRNKSSLRRVEIYKGVRIDLTAPTESELFEKIRKRKNAIDAGELVGAETGTLVRVWADKWLEVYKKPKISANNYRQYERNLALHILPSIGSMKLVDVRQYDLQAILNAKAHYSVTHQIHIKNAITGMFAAAYANRLIPVNPALGLTVTKKEDVGLDDDEDDARQKHRTMTDAEAAQFLRRADGHYAGMLFKIIFYCGLRPDEVCALSEKSFILEPDRESVDVRRAIENRTRAIRRPKTKAGVRVVPIPKVFVPDLKRFLGDKKRSGNKFLFSTGDGRPMDTDDVERWWRFFRNYVDRAEGAKLRRNKIVEHAFPEDLTPYDLRHTYCTNLQRAGVPLNVARVLMGHEKVETTAKYYTHHTDDMTDAAREKTSIFFLEKALVPVSSCGT